MHSSATRLRLISRIIVITLVILVGIIIAIHDHVSGSGGHATTPTTTPAFSGNTSVSSMTVREGTTAIVLSVAPLVSAVL